MRRADRSSSRPATIGNMIRSGWSAATRSSARSWSRQHLGPGQPQPQPPHAQCRVGLGRLAQERQRLVRAGVERAGQQRPTGERSATARYAASCSSSVGLVVGAEEHELGAEQADPVGTGGHRGRRLVGRPRLAATSMVTPSRVTAGSARPLLRPAETAGPAGGSAARPVDDVVRRDRPSTVPASPSRTTDLGAVVHGQDRVAEADHGRDPERPGQDRGVRRRSARRPSPMPWTRRGSSHAVSAGREVAGDEHAAPGQSSSPPGRPQAARRHLFGHRRQIARSLPEVLVVERFPSAREGPMPRPSRLAPHSRRRRGSARSAGSRAPDPRGTGDGRRRSRTRSPRR